MAKEFLGEFEEGHKLLTKAINFHKPEHSHLYRSLFSCDPGIYCLSLLTRSSWIRGNPETAKNNVQAALELATKLNDRRSYAFAALYSAYHYCHVRDPKKALEEAEKCVKHCEENEIVQEKVWVGPVLGWAMVELGKVEEGFEKMMFLSRLDEHHPLAC